MENLNKNGYAISISRATQYTYKIKNNKFYRTIVGTSYTEEVPVTASNKLLVLRSLYGLTQNEFALVLGIDPRAVYHYEKVNSEKKGVVLFLNTLLDMFLEKPELINERIEKYVKPLKKKRGRKPKVVGIIEQV